MSDVINPVVIIGSGPAAWSAAVYAARANLRPVVFEGEPVGTQLPGGQLMLTTDIENYPGFPAISGPELMERMKAQAVQHGTVVLRELVRAVDFRQRPFVITPHYGPQRRAHRVIIATGAAAQWLGLDNELRLATTGGGVSACATCDGAMPSYRNRRLRVVGGGDTALTEALHLRAFASEVVVIHRRSTFRASKVMADRVLADPKIRVLWNREVIDVLGKDVIWGLRLRDTVSGAEELLEVGGLFVAIGHRPNTSFLENQLALDGHGYIVVSPGRTTTRVPGVFAAGDVMDPHYRQAVTSAGSGCMAALDAAAYLLEHGAD
jgi:thioredoxin reductase (NADPH)